MKKNKKTMLITGVSGLLGNNLAYYFKDRYDVVGWYCSHKISIEGIHTRRVDITSEDSLEPIVAEYDPDVVLHCASLTDVDFCENHKELARLINSVGTQRLINACNDSKVKFVYISTDAVHDGSTGNFKETDHVNPRNYYGVTKYEGEQAVSEKENSLILRTNIFGWNIQEKYSIAEWILHELSQRHPIKSFKNAYFSSIYTFEFARILNEILEKGLKGIYNCASRTSLSKYEFACVLAERFGFNKDLIQPVDINSFPFSAARGKNLTLNVDKLSRDLNIEFPTIEESLDYFYRDYVNGRADAIKCGRKGGKWYPQLSCIPYGRQSIDDDDISAVVEVLKSSNLTQGKKVNEFERGLCDWTGAGFAVAFNSGTSALHCACLAANVEREDEVITSPNTFVASANCIVYCGAKPVFADIDSKTYNINPREIEKNITPKVKAIIPVHFAGQSCDMESISQIVKQKEKQYGRKIYIIEDACHALGSSYKGHKVGSCAYSNMTVMSFHPVKHITTGEGGVVLTNDEELFRKLRRFRSHGITNTPKEFIDKEQAYGSSVAVNPWYYEQQLLGYNYRITDIQCALGISQLKKLPFFMRRRREIASFYNKAFTNNKFIQIPYEAPDCSSNWHLYVLLFDFSRMKVSRAEFMHDLKQKGIQTQVHYIPVYIQPFYKENFGTQWGDCPRAEEYYAKCLSIPLFSTMTEADIEKVISQIKDMCKSESSMWRVR